MKYFIINDIFKHIYILFKIFLIQRELSGF